MDIERAAQAVSNRWAVESAEARGRERPSRWRGSMATSREREESNKRIRLNDPIVGSIIGKTKRKDERDE